MPSFLIKNKIDDSLIAEKLGHTVTELRKTYAHIYDSMRQDMKKHWMKHVKLNKIRKFRNFFAVRLTFNLLI